MRDSQAMALVAILLANYPRADWPESTQAAYRMSLVDFDYTEATTAVHRIVAVSDWPPSIAELRRSIVELRLGLPSEVEAWDMATRHAAARGPGAPRAYCLACASTGKSIDTDDGLCPECHGTGEQDVLDLDRMPPVPDPIPDAVRAVGGWRTVRSSERPEHLRRDFLDVYRRLRAERVERENLRMLGATGPLAVEAAARSAIES